MRLFKVNKTKLSDEELMNRFIHKDDHESLTELYSRYGDRLLGYFYKMFRGDESRAKDFLQDLFVKVIEKKHQFDTSKRFYTWVFTIASNMCKSEFRASSLYPMVGDESILHNLDANESDQLNKKEFRKVLRKSIHQLEHHHKVVFILRYQERFSIKEIAEITETSTGTVKSRIFYGTKKITEQLKDYSPDQWDQIFKIS